MVSSQILGAEISSPAGRPNVMACGTADDLLRQMMESHGGLERFSRFRTAKGSFRIDGDLWSTRGGPTASVDGRFEIGLKEQMVRLQCQVPRKIESTFTPKVVAIETCDGGYVETQYNPRSSFTSRGVERPWDDFQLAYICSYSIWNVITQPFLFGYSGFKVAEVAPAIFDGHGRRRLLIEYPSHVAGHAPTIICHVGGDGRMLRQEFSFDLLNAAVTSEFYNYVDVQGIKTPSLRRMYRKSELETSEPQVFAAVQIDGLVYM